MAIWSSSLPVYILSGFCQFISSVNLLVNTVHTYISFFLTSKHVSLLNHHLKHQLNTCISIGFFQRLSSHIFSIYVSLSGSFQTFVPIFFCWVTVYGSMFIYIPTLWFYNPDCDQSYLFYKFWLYKEWHQFWLYKELWFYIKNDIKYNCNRLSSVCEIRISYDSPTQ